MDFDFFEISLAIVAVIVTWTQVKRRISYTVGKSQDNQVVVDMEASASLPSSSSAVLECKYDVFLSFRGPDTRKGITAQIRDRLRRSGIITFMDEPDLRVGVTISPTLIKAIKESRFAIVILSQNYASSIWCLEELGEICLSKEDNRILPLFFEVDPTDVRHQKKSFEEAFSKHETSGRHESDKLNQWRAALSRMAKISGWNTSDYKTHEELVDNIVESLRSKVPADAIEFTNDFQAFGATKEATNKVMKALTDDKITAVGVYGMGGVGKTSMVRHVAAQACRNGTFNHWIIAVVSQNLDLKIVQGTLADSLGFKFVEETQAGRADRLHKEIMGKEKLLIILDDVWERTELSKIGIPTYNELEKCKSKVLLTTRRLNVCNAMKCHEKISLKVLSEQDSWTLFVRNAGTISFEPTSFEKVARRVALECKGLPIALIAVARALRDEDQEEWEKAAERLEQSQYVNPNHEKDEDNAFRCIRLSYDYLKNEDHKSCFLLCCLFPEDHNIKIKDLFRYAIGKRLFRDAQTMEVARGKLVTVVKYLKGSSLLLDSEEEGCVKMHDVIRDTAIQIAESEDCHWFFVKAGCGLKGWPPRGLHEGCTAISLMRNEIRKLPEEELVCPNLLILLLNGNAELSEIPEKLIQNLKELRVLDLSNTSISVLPQSFSLLTNLQALYLDDCGELIDISVVGKLNKLEILSMRPIWKYDVFLSFRGTDTRKGIANDICNRLSRSGIKTFMDEQGLQVGDVISPTLIWAIKKARFAIVIFSQNYASSAWCLDELREICLSIEDGKILPLFYQVNPSDVQYHGNNFKEAFSKHETSGRHESDKLNQWRAALCKVTNISGWNTNDFNTHSELVDKIVESLRSKVPHDPIESTVDFQAYEATKEAMRKVMEALTDDKITAVGVHGTGSVGKTSMLRHVATQACRNGNFNNWIMVVVSQDLDLKKIEGTFSNKLLFKFAKKTEDVRADRLHEEIMRTEKLLIILDDVWDKIQLSKIGIPNYEELQKCNSKVLLTTRRLSVCNAMECHEKIALNILSKEDSWALFVRNIGTISFESTLFKEVAWRVAGEWKGLPIAL